MQHAATEPYCIGGVLPATRSDPPNRLMDRWTEPSWSQRAPHLVQKARRVELITTTIRTD